MDYDLRYVEEKYEEIKNSMKKRGIDYPVDELLSLYKEIKQKQRELDSKRHEKNLISEKVSKGEKDINLINKAKSLNEEIKNLENEINEKKKRAYDLFLRMPNILDEDVPIGKDDSENVEIKRVGKIKSFDFTPLSHTEIGLKRDLIDLERAAKVAGSRFYYLKGKLVKLSLALENFAIDKLMSKGYIPIIPPFMMNKEAYSGITSLSDFEDALYKVTGKEDTGEIERYLISTAEHPIGAMYMHEAIPEESLPLKYVGLSPAFRREAGSHGKDTKGIFRVHQFDKVEQFIFCKPEDSKKLHEELLANAEEIYQDLEIPYRVVNICTGDIGIVASKKYDIEGFMPAQGKYRELVSCSNCTDWQSRRLDIKYVDKHGNKYFVHTLNSTAIAIERTIVAIIENYQRKDGTIEIPSKLVPYTGFKEI
ncbi:MAG: serine--tRNA ligase [Candidatus Rehaiarchaeum fermentans]|nr:serine--tRNA ligase [Candidatus Rehaiarchaeum fermentans]